MSEIELLPLAGNNPLGFLAALGALDVVHRSAPGRMATLRWSEELVPHAVMGGVDGLDELITLCDRDRESWRASALLSWPADGPPLADLKPRPDELRRWAEHVVQEEGGREQSDLLSALVAEGALTPEGQAKPTHLHFTAGQQRFVDMVRQLAAAVSPADLAETFEGPWGHAATLPSLAWEAGGERVFALRATDPASEKRGGVPGADWLAFLGLTFLPVAAANGRLRTTGCSDPYRGATFRWPLWSPAVTSRTIRSLIGDPTLTAQTSAARRARGVFALMQATIRRSAQGGYGSFSPATTALPDPSAARPRRSPAHPGVGR